MEDNGISELVSALIEVAQIVWPTEEYGRDIWKNNLEKEIDKQLSET